MSRIAYVNGQYVPHNEASVHIEDRGYQFSDGVYEVCAVLNSKIVDLEPHLERLDRSLHELRMTNPMARGPLIVAIRETVRRNRIRNGIFYLQITRGVARRDHPFPKNTRPSLVITAKSIDFRGVIKRGQSGVSVITTPDIRWGRRDVKSVSLLPNILAKQQAKDAGAYEAWMVDDEGYVTEGSSTNAWIITQDGTIVTRGLTNEILPGITRAGILKLAKEHNMKVEERKFTVEEAKRAREAFLSSTTAFATPITSIDGAPVANGAPGSFCQDLIQHYWTFLKEETGITTDDIAEIPAA